MTDEQIEAYLSDGWSVASYEEAFGIIEDLAKDLKAARAALAQRDACIAELEAEVANLRRQLVLDQLAQIKFRGPKEERIANARRATSPILAAADRGEEIPFVPQCSFCGQMPQPHELVVGPLVSICAECVEVAVDVLKEMAAAAEKRR